MIAAGAGTPRPRSGRPQDPPQNQAPGGLQDAVSRDPRLKRQSADALPMQPQGAK